MIFCAPNANSMLILCKVALKARGLFTCRAHAMWFRVWITKNVIFWKTRSGLVIRGRMLISGGKTFGQSIYVCVMPIYLNPRSYGLTPNCVLWNPRSCVDY